MPIISFVNRDIRETGQSLSVAAVAAVMAIEHNYRVIAISTDFNDKTLENSFYNSKQTSAVTSFLKNTITTDISNGAEGLIRAFASNRASADMIKSYTKPILKDRLDVLPGLKTTDYKTFVNMANYFSQIADVANASYDIVIVDVSQEIPNDVQMRILNISDLVLVGVNQSLAAVNNFLKLKTVEPFFQKSNVVIEIGKYNPYSKYSAKNIGRILREKNIPWTVPYNINFSDHASEGKIIDYLLGAKMLNDPNNQDYSFYTSVAGVADSIDYKLKELQYLK